MSSGLSLVHGRAFEHACLEVLGIVEPRTKREHVAAKSDGRAGR